VHTAQDIVLQQEYSDTFCNRSQTFPPILEIVFNLSSFTLHDSMEHSSHINWEVPVHNSDFAISDF
jgi:hypothetical protein